MIMYHIQQEWKSALRDKLLKVGMAEFQGLARVRHLSPLLKYPSGSFGKVKLSPEVAGRTYAYFRKSGRISFC